MTEIPAFTIGARLRSFTNAARGLRLLLRSQHNAWLHAAATVAAILLGIVSGLSVAEWCWIALAITVVWTAEAFNTALEALTDLAMPNLHPLAANAKDLAAAAVLLSAAGSAVIGLLVLGPHLLSRLA